MPYQLGQESLSSIEHRHTKRKYRGRGPAPWVHRIAESEPTEKEKQIYLSCREIFKKFLAPSKRCVYIFLYNHKPNKDFIEYIDSHKNNTKLVIEFRELYRMCKEKVNKYYVTDL